MDRPSSAPPDNELRPRAMSEVVRPETPTKWRLVSALPSLRRESKDASSNTVGHASGISSERRDSTVVKEGKTKKRVSLFVSRRRRPQTEVVSKEEGDGTWEGEEMGREGFRRAQSTFVKPVSADRPRAREMRRYLKYAAELDDMSFEKLKRFIRPGGIRVVNKEEETEKDEDGEVDEDFIGEICLEDFADVDDDDFDFLEDASVTEWEGETGMIRRPSLKLDSQKLRWIGNEKEFAQFFAEVGLDEWFEVERKKEVKEFNVGDQVIQEWKLDIEEHNRLCALWGSKAVRRTQDIRILEREFREGKRRCRSSNT